MDKIMTKNDLTMHGQGYRYVLVPTSGAFAPLYAKSVGALGELLRDFHNDTFVVRVLRLPRAE